jgi:hypothetical protein
MNNIKLRIDSPIGRNLLTHSTPRMHRFVAAFIRSAMRAGATAVRFWIGLQKKSGRTTYRVVASHDGAGIEDFQGFLRATDYDFERPALDDRTYGFELLHSLFRAREVSIRTGDDLYTFQPENLISGLSSGQVVTKRVAGGSGIQIDMIGGAAGTEMVEEYIAEMIGCPIPVFLNGMEVDRYHALDSDIRFTQTGVGMIHVPAGVDYPRHFAFYMDGLPIGYRTATKDAVVIHLAPTAENRNLPDNQNAPVFFDLRTRVHEIVMAQRKLKVA